MRPFAPEPNARLFIYGTLLMGGAYSGLIAGLPRRPARTRGSLYRLPAGYPAMVARTDAGWVHGELVEADPRRLMILDTLEGVSEGLYVRESLRIASGGRSTRAWVYTMTRAQIRSLGGVLIKEGSWRDVR